MPPFVYNGSMFTTVYDCKPYCGCNAPANVRRHGLRWPKNGDGIPRPPEVPPTAEASGTAPQKALWMLFS